jgi:beta-lactamase regulating signal transducer with metallopeptidase domain
MNANSIFQSLAGHPLLEVTGWTLVHFLWQAVAIAIPVSILLACMRNRDASARYLVACGGLLLMAIAPVLTAAILIGRTDPVAWQVARNHFNSESHAPSSVQSANISSTTPAVSDSGIGMPVPQNLAQSPELASSQSGTLTQWRDRIRRGLPWVVAIWSAGVIALSARLLGGLRRIGKWKREGQLIVDPEVLSIAERLGRRLGLHGKFSLLQSKSINVPAVIGWLKPVLLVPTGFACGLAPAELESLLAHELAHIRRHDWLVNLFQSVVETILFYHPAVWWMSAEIRRERENCCDDMAIETCGDRLVFARALARLEESRSAARLAMSANGVSLLARVRRILAVDEPRPSLKWPAGIASLASVALIAGSLWATTILNDPSADKALSALEANGESLAANDSESPAPNEQDWPVHQKEVDRINALTGQTHHVLAGIRMTAAGGREVSNDMMYSNVMNYTFIPESVAKELGAIELGVIDFGDKVPATRPQISVPIRPVPQPLAPDPNIRSQPSPANVFVDELTEPAGKRKIIPYDDQPIHVPDHLAFYGVNQTGQKTFRVVRIEKVNLGLGPEFGPVNALVLDDANSTIGVLGSNWARVPSGPKGEGFVWAATGDFYFMAVQPVQETALASGHPDTRDRVLATHTYDMSHRESTGWVEMDGTLVPVDAGVEHNGVKVHVSLMFHVVAVDTKSGKTLWSLPWGKTMPIWQTVSIVETITDGTPRLVVDLTDNQGLRRRVDLLDGKSVEDPQNVESGKAPEITVVQRDGKRVVAATLANPGTQRSAENLVFRFRHWLERSPHPVPGQWVTDEESLVSSDQVRYVLGDPSLTGMDADEVVFNLPEGAEMRAEFNGDNVTMESAGEIMTVTVTSGRVKLIDAGGVCRAEASADGGADLLVVECRRVDEEYSLRMKTGWSNPERGSGVTPVQVKLFLSTGAPADEEQPPHRAVRYRIDHDASKAGAPMSMKMRWHYDLSRLAAEVEQETGKSVEEVLYFGGLRGVGSPPSQTSGSLDDGEMPPFPQTTTIEGAGTILDETPWGPVAENSGLQSRLTLQTAEPKVGEPLMVKLELRNSREKPTVFDPQIYAAFRVLRVEDRQGGGTVPFIGMTPQTSGQEETLQPGEVRTVWENVDVSDLFLIDGERDYHIFAEGGEWATQTFWRDSNELVVRPAAGTLPPNQALMSALLRKLPEDWRLSHGFGGISLIHSPTGLKADITTIDLEFRTDPDIGSSTERIGYYAEGYLFATASARAGQHWGSWVADLRAAADGTLVVAHMENGPDEEREKPWTAIGQVTDADGKPLPGVTVRAHTGIGTLFNTGTALTDEDGKYKLEFGPGIWSENRKMVQAATISVSLAGHAEKNLHRQGDCVAALEMPDGEIGWGGKTVDDLFLPDKPKEIDFVMVPATRLSGVILGEVGDKLDGLRVSLRGEDMPPSSSVVAQTTTDKGGRFELADIPTGYNWQLLVEPARAESPWLGWASAPMNFRPSGDGRTHLEYMHEGKEFDLSLEILQVVLVGSGENWKSALADAATRPLTIKWDGLSTETGIHAGIAAIDLGKSDRR